MSFDENVSAEDVELLAQASRRYIQAGVEEAIRRKRKAAEPAWWSEDQWPDSLGPPPPDLDWLSWAAKL